MTGSRNQGLQKFMKGLQAERVEMAFVEDCIYQTSLKSLRLRKLLDYRVSQKKWYFVEKRP